MRKVALLLAATAWFGSALYAQAGASQPAQSFDKKAMEEFIRHLFVWGPQITVQVGDPKPSTNLPGFREVPVTASAGQASQQVTFLVGPDGKKIIQGAVYDLDKNPFAADHAKIRTDLQPSFGTPGAPAVLVIYSDFQCSFCREEAKVIRENVAKTFPNDVRVYFKDFPLESIHPWAKPAAIAGKCIFRQKPAAFWDYHDWIFAHQPEITPENLKEKVLEFAKSKSLEPVQLNACIDNKATEADVDRAMAEGHALGVNSTPTVFVNGRKVVGQVPWQQLKQIIEHEIEYAKKNKGGEKCCEVKLPSGIPQ